MRKAQGVRRALALWCLAMATLITTMQNGAVSAGAHRFTVKNDVKPRRGQRRFGEGWRMRFHCWADGWFTDKDLGWHSLAYGESKTFEVERPWTLYGFAHYKCSFKTCSGHDQKDVTMFPSKFRSHGWCGNPRGKELHCSWIMKRDGIYLRNMRTFLGDKTFPFDQKWVSNLQSYSIS